MSPTPQHIDLFGVGCLVGWLDGGLTGLDGGNNGGGGGVGELHMTAH